MNVLFLADLSTLAGEAWVWFIAPVAAVAALVAALMLSRDVMARSEGEPEMIEIAGAVRAGAMAYLKRQYKVVGIVFFLLLVILVALGLAGILSLVTPVGVLFAGLFSGTCGWFVGRARARPVGRSQRVALLAHRRRDTDPHG